MAHGLRITIPKLLRIKPGIISKLGKYLANEKFESIALLWGEGMEGLLGNSVLKSLSEHSINVIWKDEISSIDIRQCFDNALKLPSSVKAIVSIGGGKVMDHGKYIAHSLKIPLIVVPTIISNDGICSSLSSLMVDGKRKTVKTTIPHGVIVDLDVVASAPKSFIFSGVGDLVCKGSAISDWKLAYHQTGEYVDDFAVMMAQNAFEAFMNFHPKNLDNYSFLRTIVSSLIMIGVAMEVAGKSRPASGSEHLISHALDQISKKPHGHGIQVGVASLITTYLQSEESQQAVLKVLEETGFLDFVEQNPLKQQELIEAIELAPTIKKDFVSILSSEDNRRRAIKYIQSNELMQRLTR